jgi:hypothetical protein
MRGRFRPSGAGFNPTTKTTYTTYLSALVVFVVYVVGGNGHVAIHRSAFLPPVSIFVGFAFPVVTSVRSAESRTAGLMFR